MKFDSKCAKICFKTMSRKHSKKKTEYDLHNWKRFFLRVGKARKIEEIPAE